MCNHRGFRNSDFDTGFLVCGDLSVSTTVCKAYDNTQTHTSILPARRTLLDSVTFSTAIVAIPWSTTTSCPGKERERERERSVFEVRAVRTLHLRSPFATIEMPLLLLSSLSWTTRRRRQFCINPGETTPQSPRLHLCPCLAAVMVQPGERNMGGILFLRIKGISFFRIHSARRTTSGWLFIERRMTNEFHFFSIFYTQIPFH